MPDRQRPKVNSSPSRRPCTLRGTITQNDAEPCCRPWRRRSEVSTVKTRRRVKAAPPAADAKRRRPAVFRELRHLLALPEETRQAVGDEAKVFPVRQLEGFLGRGLRHSRARFVVEPDNEHCRLQIAFRRRVDDLDRDEIGFAHFCRAAVAGDRYRLAQLLIDPGPQVHAALGPPLRIARDASLELAVLGRTPIADFIVGTRPSAIPFVFARHDLSIARTRLGKGGCVNLPDMPCSAPCYSFRRRINQRAELFAVCRREKAEKLKSPISLFFSLLAGSG